MLPNRNIGTCAQPFGCREGKLSFKFTAADLQVISENLLSTDEVPDAEISLRTAVTKATGGQGYVKCMCLSGCSSGRCSCSRKRAYFKPAGSFMNLQYREERGDQERLIFLFHFLICIHILSPTYGLSYVPFGRSKNNGPVLEYSGSSPDFQLYIVDITHSKIKEGPDVDGSAETAEVSSS
ncbi:hypothetical protein T07_9547 [Trichinella nelsoni]|uniref:Uncharacterized protein n=1 Tax=Trichinella nelsoni TaxID=6336 RepID=A0A0V0S6U5_9BILA|nr:hypothetical protein T07_9547 [Trichinella nelsoni]